MIEKGKKVHAMEVEGWVILIYNTLGRMLGGGEVNKEINMVNDPSSTENYPLLGRRVLN